MNKINMNDSIIKINNEKLILTHENNIIEVYGECEIEILNETINNLDIKLNENSSLIINDFRIISSSETQINISSNEKSHFIYNHSFINNKKYDLKIKAEFEGNESSIILNIHGINDTGETNIIIDGILSNKLHNSLLENIRLININSGRATAIPNMLASSSHIIANHNVTISKITPEELTYLMSKGISKEEAIKLILNGFLINIYSVGDFITKIKEIIKWR